MRECTARRVRFTLRGMSLPATQKRHYIIKTAQLMAFIYMSDAPLQQNYK